MEEENSETGLSIFNAASKEKELHYILQQMNKSFKFFEDEWFKRYGRHETLTINSVSELIVKPLITGNEDPGCFNYMRQFSIIEGLFDFYKTFDINTKDVHDIYSLMPELYSKIYTLCSDREEAINLKMSYDLCFYADLLRRLLLHNVSEDVQKDYYVRFENHSIRYIDGNIRVDERFYVASKLSFIHKVPESYSLLLEAVGSLSSMPLESHQHFTDDIIKLGSTFIEKSGIHRYRVDKVANSLCIPFVAVYGFGRKEYQTTKKELKLLKLKDTCFHDSLNYSSVEDRVVQGTLKLLYHCRFKPSEGAYRSMITFLPKSEDEFTNSAKHCKKYFPNRFSTSEFLCLLNKLYSYSLLQSSYYCMHVADIANDYVDTIMAKNHKGSKIIDHCFSRLSGLLYNSLPDSIRCDFPIETVGKYEGVTFSNNSLNILLGIRLNNHGQSYRLSLYSGCWCVNKFCNMSMISMTHAASQESADFAKKYHIGIAEWCESVIINSEGIFLSEHKRI